MNRYIARYSVDTSTPNGPITEYKEAEVVADSIEDARYELKYYFGINGIHNTTIHSLTQANDGPGVYSDKLIYSENKSKREAIS